MSVAIDAFKSGSLGISTSIDDIVESLEFLDGWEDRYRFLIDLGRELAAMPEALKNDETIVHGCQSQVWLASMPDSDGKLYFLVDSEAHIVRGLAALVLASYNGKTPAEIQAVDFEAALAGTDLIRHISPTRGNGLRSMIAKIRMMADNAA